MDWPQSVGHGELAVVSCAIPDFEKVYIDFSSRIHHFHICLVYPVLLCGLLFTVTMLDNAHCWQTYKINLENLLRGSFTCNFNLLF